MRKTLVLGGDFNVCPSDDDVYDPAGFADDALCRTGIAGPVFAHSVI